MAKQYSVRKKIFAYKSSHTINAVRLDSVTHNSFSCMDAIHHKASHQLLLMCTTFFPHTYITFRAPSAALILTRRAGSFAESSEKRSRGTDVSPEKSSGRRTAREATTS